MNFKSSQLKAIILLTSIVATLLFFQNCGRVGVTENVVVDSVTEPVSPLALSVSSQLVVEVLVDTKTSFEVPTKDDSSSIQNISLDSSENKYKAKTQYNGDIDIDIEIWKMSYTPPVGLIGNDDTQLYITGEDGNTLTLEVAFVIKSKTPQLTDLHALIYGDSDQDRQLLENKLNNYEAPGMDVVFARWQSFAAELLFENQAAIEIPAEIGFCDSEQDPITGEFARVVDPETGKTINPGHYSKCANNPFFAAKSWALLPTPDRIYCAANSGKLTGFISPLKFESYLHEAILTSAHGDDDNIGIVIAFHRDEDGKNHLLGAMRNNGGTAPVEGWGLVYYIDGRRTKIFDPKSVDGVRKNKTGDDTGWRGRKTMVRISREGNIIKAYTGNWDKNESALSITPSSLIELDLDAESELAIFKGPKSYGYMSFSQAGSEYRDVVFETGANDNYVYDLKEKKVYEKQPNGDFLPRPDLDAFSHIGYPRKVSNPETGITYQLNEDKSFSVEE